MIHRFPLDRQVREALLERIVRGDLPPGTHLVEARFCEELGVSRTPLRAALTSLERDGLVVARPGRGWTVAPLDPGEARELYPILHSLEDLALRTAGIPAESTLRRLGEINNRLRRQAATPRKAVALNLEWHRTLTSGCANRPLMDLLEGVRRQVTRFEHAFFRRGAGGVETSASHHEAIRAALARGRLEEASRALREHWLADLEFMLPRPAGKPAPPGRTGTGGRET